MAYDFHPEARLEYREAAAFYETRCAGLGAVFTIEVVKLPLGASFKTQQVGERLNKMSVAA